MTNTRDIIIKLKEVREEKKLSINDICKLIEESGGYVSRSTVQRVLAEGSEDSGFNYEETIRPIANALLDIETIEADDNMDIQAMKSLLKYKIERIEELEETIKNLKAELNQQKVKYHERLDREREVYNTRIDFLTNQISLKDKRMDQLLEAVFTKDHQHKELLELVLSCPARTNANNCQP